MYIQRFTFTLQCHPQIKIENCPIRVYLVSDVTSVLSNIECNPSENCVDSLR